LCQSRKTSGTSASQATSTTGSPSSSQLASNRGATSGTGAMRPTAAVIGETPVQHEGRSYLRRRVQQGSLPPCGGGRGRGVATGTKLSAVSAAHGTVRAWGHPPPHPSPARGEGADRVCCAGSGSNRGDGWSHKRNRDNKARR